MASTIGAFATIIASLGTLFFVIMGFSISVMPQPPIDFTGHVFGGYAVMVWFGVVALAFGWASVYYTLKLRHFGLAVIGTVFIFVSCFLETAILTYAPHYGITPPLVVTWGPVILMQLLFSFAGIFFTVKSKKHFTV